MVKYKLTYYTHTKLSYHNLGGIKLKKICMIFLAAAAATAFTGCSDKKGVSSSESILSGRKDPESITFSWQDAYEKKIGEFKNSEEYSEKSAFDIFDVTGDGSPELIISPNDDTPTKCTIYTFVEDKLTEILQAGNSGCFSYSPETNVIKDEYLGNGFVLGKILTFSNGSFNNTLSYSDNSDSASLGAEIYHEINGENVSLADYEKELAPYTGISLIEAGRRYTMGDSSVKYAIRYAECWKDTLSSGQKKLCREILETEMTSAQAEARNAAFDFCDLNGDKVAELIISHGADTESSCTVYYFSNENLVAMDGNYGKNGVFSFDTEHYVFFEDKGSDSTYWSIANSGFTADEYKKSDSIAVTGRKYLISESGLSAVFD